jgi:hypothetical protein
MLLGGLWHGPGWNFVLWGGLHGLYLVIYSGWQRVVPHGWSNNRIYRQLAWLLTFVAVVIAWVPFRASTMAGAVRILSGMVGGNGISLPNAIGARIGSLRSVLEQYGIDFTLGGGSEFVGTWSWIGALFLVVRFLPNTQELLGRFEPALYFDPPRSARLLAWRPTALWALVTAGIAAIATLALSQVSEFLYFQF